MSDVKASQDRAAAELGMHSVYTDGGQERQVAPHVIYADASCPHAGCEVQLRGIDFRLETHGKDLHDPLIRAWWDDVGFAGRCPGCSQWVHFTIRAKSAIEYEDAKQLPQLPERWFDQATIL
jgi:hypothetical protein